MTDRIVAAIEAGTPPWRKPWTGGRSGAALPLRAFGEPYRGINGVLLWLEANAKGYASPHWFTYRQAQELGTQVRKGEKSAPVIKFGTFEADKDEAAAEDAAASTPGAYYATLAHEAVHWTGQGNRLDRLAKFADRSAYAFEELVAELGNVNLRTYLGLMPDFGQGGICRELAEGAEGRQGSHLSRGRRGPEGGRPSSRASTAGRTGAAA